MGLRAGHILSRGNTVAAEHSLSSFLVVIAVEQKPAVKKCHHIAGMNEAASVVISKLASVRTEEAFREGFSSSSSTTGRLQLNDIEMPRRYTGTAEAYNACVNR